MDGIELARDKTGQGIRNIAENRRFRSDSRGTAHDPFRGVSDDIPDYIRSVIPNDRDDGIQMSSMGFSAPVPGAILSPALQRQISLLTGDKEVDYFLFDEVERPIRFQIPDMILKMHFRIFRSGAFSGDKKAIALEPMAEYILKMMSNHPGLNRERIVAQLTREYGEDLPAKLVA